MYVSLTFQISLHLWSSMLVKYVRMKKSQINRDWVVVFFTSLLSYSLKHARLLCQPVFIRMGAGIVCIILSDEVAHYSQLATIWHDQAASLRISDQLFVSVKESIKLQNGPLPWQIQYIPNLTKYPFYNIILHAVKPHFKGINLQKGVSFIHKCPFNTKTDPCAHLHHFVYIIDVIMQCKLHFPHHQCGNINCCKLT